MATGEQCIFDRRHQAENGDPMENRCVFNTDLPFPSSEPVEMRGSPERTS